MRILIIKLGAIGDVLRTTSVLPGLKEKYQPQAIDWITLSSGRKVLIDNPFINRIFLWEERNSLESYDLVISLEDDLEAGALASKINSKRLLGTYVKDGSITYTPSAWFDMSAISRFGLETANQLKKKNRKTFQQHVAELLEVKVGPYIFSLTTEEIEYGKKFLREQGLGVGGKVVGINTGAGKRWQLKSLSIDKTIDLVSRLKKDLGVVSLILGGEEERERNEIICRETGMPNGGVHSLRNFAGVVNQCQLVVSSDSLAMHFAIALGKRVVAFFGPTSPFEIELYGQGSKVYPEIDCLVCYEKQCMKERNCIDVLDVNNMVKAVQQQGYL